MRTNTEGPEFGRYRGMGASKQCQTAAKPTPLWFLTKSAEDAIMAHSNKGLEPGLPF
jgi:hypothetical protein